MKNMLFHAWWILFVFILANTRETVASENSGPDETTPSFYEKIHAEWGGQVKAAGSSSWFDDSTLYRIDEDNPYYDGSASLRLKNRLHFSDTSFFDIHYEAVMAGGDTVRKGNELRRLSPALDRFSFFNTTISDDRRLFRLTAIVDERDDYTLYHRLDRFAVTMQPKWGTICLGRQALTWGNGLLFNPMDLFNPFSPTDIERDYKVGDDMASLQVHAGSNAELQFLLVPRRNPATDRVEVEESSFAGKGHFALDSNEFDLLIARHYEENVVGVGSSGYFRDAVWRMDIIWSSLNRSPDRDGYFSAVANMDYSWVWWSKNMYGFVEFYFNGLGTDQYSGAYQDQEIARRLERGELFFLGRSYLSGQVNLEVHPLFTVYLTVINNLEDPSGIIQPWAVWNMTQNTMLTLGANLYYGGHETEFGGYDIESTPYCSKPPESVFLWLTWYF